MRRGKCRVPSEQFARSWKVVVPMRRLSWILPEAVHIPMGPGKWPRFIGGGWQALLNDLHGELVRLDPACFVYEASAAEYGALALRFQAPPAVATQARALVDATVATSRKTCEQCGDRGQLYGGPWLVTLCSRCAPL